MRKVDNSLKTLDKPQKPLLLGHSFALPELKQILQKLLD